MLQGGLMNVHGGIWWIIDSDLDMLHRLDSFTRTHLNLTELFFYFPFA